MIGVVAVKSARAGGADDIHCPAGAVNRHCATHICRAAAETSAAGADGGRPEALDGW
jgi:hypothetical protein